MEALRFSLHDHGYPFLLISSSYAGEDVPIVYRTS